MMHTEVPLAVEVTDLVKRFGAFTAVDHISFTVPKGEIFGFLGPNGAGKSTTIRMLCGILVPTAGSGRVAGFDVVTESERIKTRIGYMSQKFSLYEDLTVEENIEFYGGVYGVSRHKLAERKQWILEMANLTERRTSLTGELAMGWKQRLALGCAIVHEPEILFLDEPTAGVDPISRRTFWDLIYDVAGQGVTVFVTTHYMDEAEHCDRLAMIYNGQLIALGSPQALKDRTVSGVLLDIQAQPAMAALEALEEAPGVTDVTIFGSALHVIVETADAIPSLRDYLTARQITVTALEPILPSLEDAFVALIEQADQQAAMGKE
ncbi:MAG: putative ABC transporter ATP-binding protein YbhF [bacterium ADurb.Bin429]|nr:MAG: putative ABC transporter ATP-binding protein YbhF [bacterium ADurb.Bin429]